MSGSLILQNVVSSDANTHDIRIENGIICEIASNIPIQKDSMVLDGQGCIVTPSFVNAHIHPAQTFVGEAWADYEYKDTVPERAEAEAEYLKTHRMDAKRACRVQFLEAIRRGTGHIRGHIDIGGKDLEEIRESMLVKKTFQDYLDVEFIAMPSNGILNMLTDPWKSFAQAAELGVTGIGGADPCDRDKDPVRSVDTTLRIAAEFGLKVDLHLHEFGEMGLFSLDLILKKAKELHLENRITISHAWCLALLKEEKLKSIASNLVDLGIGIVTHVPGHVPFPSLKKLQSYTVKYGVGTDNTRNLWSPYGMNDMLERVMLLSYLSDFRKREDLEHAYDAATYGSAEVLGIRDYGLSVGCSADLVVFAVENKAMAVVETPLPRFVIKKGELVSQDGKVSELLLNITKN